MRLFTVFRGRAKTCGDCSLIKLDSGQSVHGFTYAGPTIEVHSGSSRKLEFRCKCGQIVRRRLDSIKHGSTCGKCFELHLLPGDPYKGFTYAGETPINIGPWSKERLAFRCRCGNVKHIGLSSITCGDVVSCTECYSRVFSWYSENQAVLKKLQCPISPDDVPDGLFKPLETILSANRAFRARCPACGNTYKPRLNDVKRLKCITCGCTNNVVSAPNCQISAFIRGLGFSVEQEHKIGLRAFDLYVPAANLLIELHGIRWHSKPDSKKRDFEKYLMAVASGCQAIWIYEDEWKHRQRAFQAIIARKLGIRPAAVRLNKCDVRQIDAAEANKLYEKFHYIGKCACSVSFGVLHGERLIAAMSFRKPLRQNSSCDFEMARMVVDPDVRVHGAWSKLLNAFRDKHPGASVVAYSDNRLFDGATYGKVGFQFDRDIKRDYYWARGDNRFHKSALRKPKGFDGTESALRESQGYRKIWDFGKKRWFLG